ncbi:MAG: ABC transporter permease [Bacillota bacterium]
MLHLSYAGFELRKWWRDSMSRFMLLYPLLLGAVGRFIIPFAENQSGTTFALYYHVILATLALMVGRIGGAVVAFSILDDRDDNVLFSVQVAPLSVEFFIGLKLFLVFVLTWVGTAFVLWFANLVPLPAGVILGTSFLAAFGAPLAALLINCVSKNKVEGFAAMKSLGALLIFPVAALFFVDIKEFLFALDPAFWPAKALSTAILGEGIHQLGYTTYLALGLVYVAAATVLAYRVFKRRLI